MYQDKILATILSGDTAAFNTLEDRAKVAFSEPENYEFYTMLYNYFLDYNKTPSIDYLQSFFNLEKDNPCAKVFKRLDLKKITDDLAATCRLQITYVVRSKTIALQSDHTNQLKLCNGSELQGLIQDNQSKLSELNQLLNTSPHKRGLLYGENALRNYKVRYAEMESSDKGYYIGKTGFDNIDSVIGGIHSVDKITLIGFTNQGKSPFLRQIGYNLLMQGLNVMFVSLEMSFESVETAFYAVHANNTSVFGFNNPKITSKKLREAILNEEEKSYFFDKVVDDFNNNESYGSLYIFQPEGIVALDDLILEITQVQRTVMPIDVLVMDYAVPLLLPQKNKVGLTRSDYDEMHRRLRAFGLSFENGRGLPIIDAAQTNRKGFEDALSVKNKDNLYNLTAIGEYNSLEKDSTHVISILQTDAMRVDGVAQIQHLKSRESALFPHFKAQFDNTTGYLKSSASQDLEESDVESLILELEL